MQLIYPNVEGSGEIYLEVMKAICGKTSDKSMVDLGCHHAPYTPLLGFKERTYVDIQNRPLDHKEEQQFFVKKDIIKFLQQGNNYDVTISSDSLEHLTIRRGRTLVSLMERYSEKQIVFTPLGEYMITEDANPDSHKSGWKPEYFEGWATIIFPDFHKALNIGAFFAFNCSNVKQEFSRVKNELNNATWIK